MTHRGFSLVESLVAITILTTAIGAPMFAVNSGLQSARWAKNEVIAYYLAQEAVEGLRFLRDNAILSNEPPFSRFISCVGPGVGPEKKCSIDEQNLDTGPSYGMNECIGACPVLKFDPTANRYGYQSGNETVFRRDVFMQETHQAPPGTTREVRVRVVVSWSDKGTSRAVTVAEVLDAILIAL